MERRLQGYEKLLDKAEVVLKQINSIARHLEYVCNETPERITLEFILRDMNEIKKLVKEYNETDVWTNQNLTPPPAVFRMNAEENRSGAGAGPDPSFQTNLTASLSSSGTSTTGHLFAQHYKGLDTKQ